LSITTAFMDTPPADTLVFPGHLNCYIPAMQPARIPVVVIAGPTASGKSKLALEAARAFDGTVINADSMQVYRELRILTARPSPQEEELVPHRLYGVMSAAERCTAGHWAQLAKAAVLEAVREGRLPIVAGGTGFYINALMHGLSAIPEVPPEARAEAAAAHAALGAEAFHAELARVDPAAAARLPAADTQRLTRAYEVWLATERPLSDWQAEPPVRPLPGADFLVYVLDPPRDGLTAAIDRRLDAMMAAGALDEVRRLKDMALDPGLPAMKALGVPDLLAYLEGRTGYGAAVAAAKLQTRQFAKRQASWFRTQVGPAERLSEQFSERLAAEIFPKIRDFVLTTQK
jgi:tRNA dimethylallyltransferase